MRVRHVGTPLTGSAQTCRWGFVRALARGLEKVLLSVSAHTELGSCVLISLLPRAHSLYSLLRSFRARICVCVASCFFIHTIFISCTYIHRHIQSISRPPHRRQGIGSQTESRRRHALRTRACHRLEA